jgi:signal transduction histidine kinase
VIRRFWPKSLQGQLLLTVALALLLAQAIGATLIYHAQQEFREAVQVHTAAMRLLRATRGNAAIAAPNRVRRNQRNFAIDRSNTTPQFEGERRNREAETYLRQLLTDQDVEITDAVVINRAVKDDPQAFQRAVRRNARFGRHAGPQAERLILAGIRLPSGEWLVTRVMVPPGEFMLVVTLIAQTLLIYAVLVGAIAFILRRITRPLATLTGQVERFAETRDPASQIAPEGPEDIRRLIVAHNGMEARIAALLDEKDVMLGAIGHDLKTPLAALRVRIESIEDDSERSKMAATIDDITRSLDDILSLARAGHTRQPREMTELSALLGSVVEEYEDMGSPVTLEFSERLALPLHATWLRRGVRNLIDNALRYGQTARVSLAREGAFAVCRIDDDGPGIAESDMARMLEPFTRGDPSRNSATGGAGLGLALARAIAEQHGGELVLINRRDDSGEVRGLTAELKLPLS